MRRKEKKFEKTLVLDEWLLCGLKFKKELKLKNKKLIF